MAHMVWGKRSSERCPLAENFLPSILQVARSFTSLRESRRWSAPFTLASASLSQGIHATALRCLSFIAHAIVGGLFGFNAGQRARSGTLAPAPRQYTLESSSRSRGLVYS